MANSNAKITVTLVDKTKAGFAAIGKSVKAARAGLNKVGLAATAAGAGFALLSKSSIEGASELRNLAAVANASASELSSLGFATETIGISTEKFADILKDTNDKIGDFSQAGAGPLADFFENIAPKIGVTADAFKNLSGPQALQKYFNSLEQANLSQAELIFYLEAIASDASALIPLLRNNGEAFAEQARRAEALGLVLSDLDVASIDTLGQNFARLSKVGTGFVDRVLVKFSPLLVGILEDFESLITEAGGFQSVIDKAFGFAIRAAGVFADGIRGINLVFNLLKSAAAGAIGVIATGLGKVGSLVAKITGNEGLKGASEAILEFGKTSFAVLDESTNKAKELSLSILPSEVIKRKASDYENFGNKIIAKNAQIAASNIGIEGGEDSEVTKKRQQRAREKFAAIQGENSNELALNKAKLDAKLQQDIEFLQEQETIRLIGEQQVNEQIEAARAAHGAKMLQIEQKTINDLLSQQLNYAANSALVNEQLAERQRTIDALSAEGKKTLAAQAFRETLQVASSGSKKLFELNKNFALAEAVVNGFKAIQSGFATTPFFPVGLAMGALATVKTLAQIQGIQATKFSGKSASGPKPGASAGGAAPSIQGNGNGNGSLPPEVRGPAEEKRKAQVVVTGDLNERDRLVQLANSLVELSRDGFNELEIATN